MARRKPMRLVALGGAAVVLILLALNNVLDWFGQGGAGPAGKQAALSPQLQPPQPENSAPAPVPSLPSRPLQVVIEGREYLVGDAVFSADGIVAMAQKVPAGDGPAVVIRRAASSRASAEENLRALLKEAGVDFEWRNGPRGESQKD